jgi:hypothetical protein
MNTIQRRQAMIVGFIGVTMSVPLAILLAVPSQIACMTGLTMPVYPPSMRIQKRTNPTSRRPILHANRFCTAPTQVSSHFLRNNLTNNPKILHLGSINTLRAKSMSMILTNTSGIE